MTPLEVEKIFRGEAGRALATLIRLVGDFDLAEDVLQEAFAAALQRWPATACRPIRGRGWSMSDATRRSIASGVTSRFAASTRN
jgi:RNA polymerase sigma-70 factor (ECF subfamily)